MSTSPATSAKILIVEDEPRLAWYCATTWPLPAWPASGWTTVAR